MSAFLRIFRQKPGTFGEAPVSAAAFFGTGGLALTATATVNVQIPKGYRKFQLTKVAVNAFKAAAGGGAITGQLFKVVGGNAGTRTALTAAFDLTVGGITTIDKWLVIAITGTDTQCVLQEADALTFDIVAATTVTTVPQGCVAVNLAKM